ncbi:MAG: putative membrane protein, partial [uncultured Solirubrobacterales bacterium]
ASGARAIGRRIDRRAVKARAAHAPRAAAARTPRTVPAGGRPGALAPTGPRPRRALRGRWPTGLPARGHRPARELRAWPAARRDERSAVWAGPRHGGDADRLGRLRAGRAGRRAPRRPRGHGPHRRSALPGAGGLARAARLRRGGDPAPRPRPARRAGLLRCGPLARADLADRRGHRRRRRTAGLCLHCARRLAGERQFAAGLRGGGRHRGRRPGRRGGDPLAGAPLARCRRGRARARAV